MCRADGQQHRGIWISQAEQFNRHKTISQKVLQVYGPNHVENKWNHKSQFCTWVKSWPDWLLWIKIRGKRNFTRFELWAHKLFAGPWTQMLHWVSYSFFQFKYRNITWSQWSWFACNIIEIFVSCMNNCSAILKKKKTRKKKESKEWAYLVD